MSLFLEQYSEKSFVLLGSDTKLFKDEIKVIGGKWNNSLSSKEGNKFGGWIFPNTKKNVVSNWILTKNKKKEIENPEIPTSDLDLEFDIDINIRKYIDKKINKIIEKKIKELLKCENETFTLY